MNTFEIMSNKSHKKMGLDLTVIPNMACITDAGGQVLETNSFFLEQLDIAKEDINKLTLSSLFSPANKIKAVLETAKSNKNKIINTQLTIKTNIQQKYLAHIKSIRLSNKLVFVWSMVDISNLRESMLKKQREIKNLDEVNSRLILERDYLRETTLPIRDINDMVGRSPVFNQMVERITSVADTEASVLVCGESGSGKELVARMIHERSCRKEEPLVTVNCASIPAELFESEFFGHIKGAFSGAVQNRIGRFEMANKGTLFLDEVGEIPIELQSKLLRSIQQKSFERVGENLTREVDVRIIAATNRDLGKEVEAGTFREDLYYRLSVFPITVPPLRKRKDDIIPLAEFFLEQAQLEFNRETSEFSEEQKIMLRDYSWPGNIRELKNVIERAVILFDKQLRLDLAMPVLALQEINSDITTAYTNDTHEHLTDTMLKQIEYNNLINVLEKTNWRISGPAGAAALLEMNSSTLNSKLRALNITRPDNDSIYSLIGGFKKISKIINELLPSLRSDPQLGRFWKDRGADSIRNEKKHLIDFVCYSTGGPFSYKGRNMLQVHKGMNISLDDWSQFLTIFTSVLQKNEIEKPVQKKLLALVENIRAEIVEV